MSRRRLLAYQPALDGLRGLALLAIVVFHAELPWAPGAFLSVSTFFTLSGFLITVLLLEEEHASGRADLKAFWSRRLRRLLPASLVTIALIVLLSAFLAGEDQLRSLRGDALASLAYVANWRFIATDASYGAIFESPSPLAHFWTLAIEEQYYLVFPAALAGLLLLTRTAHRWVVTAFLAAAAIGSAAWAAYLFRHGATLDRVYYGTDTRIGELMVGGLLAIGWRRYRTTLTHPSMQRTVAVVGAIALVAMLLLWNQASLTQTFWYQGGLTLYALLTCVVIIAAMNATGPARSALSLRPLAWIGVVSYGAYLWHWPILVWLDAKTGLNDEARFAIGLALTLVAATLSARLVERPVVAGGNVGPIAAKWAAPLGVAAVAALILATTAVVAPAGPAELARPEDLTELTESGPDLDDDEKDALRAAVEASTAPVVGVFGDSTALQTALGLVEWSYHNAEVLRPGGGWSVQGCGLIPEADRVIDGVVSSPPPECAGWLDGWRAEMERYAPDIAYVQLGTWEVFDTVLDGDEALALGEDPELDQLVEARLTEAVELLLTEVPVVVLASSPDIEFGRQDGRPPSEQAPASDPARMARFRQIVDAVAARHPDRVRVVDLAGYLESRGDDDTRLRPDGIHFSAETAYEVAEWLGPALSEIHLDVTGTDVGQDAREPANE